MTPPAGAGRPATGRTARRTSPGRPPATTTARQHAEWLSLIEVSGPFLTLPVLSRALPMGLEPTTPDLVADLRTAHAELMADSGLGPRWVEWVLRRLLGMPDEVLLQGAAIGPALRHRVDEHQVELAPDWVVADPAREGGPGRPRLLVSAWPAGTRLDQLVPGSRWAATPVDRMAELCRATGVRLGLVTNHHAWVLLDARMGQATGTATWDAELWLEERATLDAFTTLVGARRLFGVAEPDTLEALLDASGDAEAEVTDQLGAQVRSAVELLVDALSRANRERGGALFAELTHAQIYEGAVAVMMRLVFLLSAEERDLFLLGDPVYDAGYAASTLRAQLEEEADRWGEDVLETRRGAWWRLLATFRLVHAGSTHEDLRLAPYGSSLFDPDRYPVLEGRQPGQPWLEFAAAPLPVDDRTVFRVLDALQVLRFSSPGGVNEARRLSFRSLDVEQIGHVYEGLLDHAVVPVDEAAVGLEGKLEPEVALALVEAAAARGRDHLVAWLVGQTGLSAKGVARALDARLDPEDMGRLVSACDNDRSLAERVRPYLSLVRRDLRGLPQVYLPGAFVVTASGDRRSTGTYYTPKSLAEEMVAHALEPLVYAPGPADGVAPEAWRLRPAAELLELKVCDMAMGSGAFLVATCRYLAARLVEAWAAEGLVASQTVTLGEGHALALPSEEADREILARRLVADRCLYGVDRNPMAVEMAKLSLWLVTLAKDRPFSFLDHALRVGDSLLGITDLAQLHNLHLDPEAGRRILGANLFDPFAVVDPLVKEAVRMRRELESFPVLDVVDAQAKLRLFSRARDVLSRLRVVGDVVVGAALSTAAQGGDALESRLVSAAPEVTDALGPERAEDDRAVRLADLASRAEYWLDEGRPAMAPDRTCLHWPLEFPEVFGHCSAGASGGFDAVVGNPPFLGGKRISGPFGASYREHLVRSLAGGRTGNADLVAYFFLRAASVVRRGGSIALLATNTIAQGDTREVGLDWLTTQGWSIPRAVKSRRWPGSASLEVAQVWLHHGRWEGAPVLEGRPVAGITPALDPASRTSGPAHRLRSVEKRSFQGSILATEGFILSPGEAERLLARNPRNADVVMPYLNGENLNTRPDCSASRWVINFRDWSLERAAEYPDCLWIVQERVKPEVLAKPASYRGWDKRWWQFWNIRSNLYAAIEKLDRVLVIAQVSKTVQPVFVPNGQILSQKLVVFADNDDAHFGILTSGFHYWWTIKHSATMRTDLSYSPTDCFETFPQPVSVEGIGPFGRALDEHRRRVMAHRNEGLTTTYNRVHDPKDDSGDIDHLRRLHTELDHAVAAAYGWDDLELDHGHWETAQGTRFTIGAEARVEVLDRLLELNHARHAEEVALGLRGPKRKPRRRPDATTLWGDRA